MQEPKKQVCNEIFYILPQVENSACFEAVQDIPGKCDHKIIWKNSIILFLIDCDICHKICNIDSIVFVYSIHENFYRVSIEMHMTIVLID